MTGLTFYSSVVKRIFDHIFNGLMKLFIDLSILFFLSIGLYSQLAHGGRKDEDYLASSNTTWILVQNICLYVICAACGVMVLATLLTAVIRIRKFIKERKLRKKTENSAAQENPSPSPRQVSPEQP